VFALHTIPSPALLKAVRAGLIIKGSSLSAWAAANGVKRQNLTKALVGDWKGKKAAELVEKVTSDVSEYLK
jgi:lambda repressor-like predicted transcriptional regulator